MDETNRTLLPVAWDSESHYMKAACLAPPVVCVTLAHRDHRGEIVSEIVAGREALRAAYASLDQDDTLQILCNAAFDQSAKVAFDTDFLPAVFQAYEEERIHDVAIREKFLNLSTTGRLEFVPLPDGSVMRMDYSLAELELYHLSIDRSKDKVGEDAWRNNYAMFDGTPLSQWPEGAKQYALDDAIGTFQVWEKQEIARREIQGAHGFDPFKTHGLRAKAAFALRLMQCWGIATDQLKRAEILIQLERELHPSRLQNLVSSGILELPRPYKSGKLGPDGLPLMVRGGKSKMSTIALHAHILQVCAANGLEVKRNDPSPTELEEAERERREAVGSVRADKDAIEDLWHLSPILAEYKHLQYLKTLRDKELPRLAFPFVYCGYYELVETGRTSCRQDDEIPSTQIQNVTKIRKLKDEAGKETGEEINVREIYVPRPRHVLCSNDFSSLEFVAMAQTCYSLFGESAMRDRLIKGIDPHAYLGAQLAWYFDHDFRAACAAEGIEAQDDIFEVFKTFKHSKSEVEQALYKKYRALAKPVGFGFPGGLGPDRFVEFARSDYQIIVDVATAKILKEIWLKTYPEMKKFFHYVNTQCKNPDGTFSYVSPLGMVRANTDYCSACNGLLLQTPGAEAALLALWDVTRACYDKTQGSMLLGCHPVWFIHDDVGTELPLDDYMHERGFEIERLMVNAAKRIFPDVPISAPPALQLAWNKEAETVLDENGRLTIWTPKPKKVIVAA